MGVLESFHLTDEQKHVAESFGKSQAVIAGAGSGKTTTLVAKCMLFISLFPRSHFCAVSFTEKSADDLKKKLLKGISDLSAHTVTTIHGLCGKIIKDFTFESGLQGDEEVLNEFEGAELWSEAFHSLWEDDIPEEIKNSFFYLMERESLSGIQSLLTRVREAAHFGALERLKEQENDFEAQALVILSGFVISKYEFLKRKKGWIDFNDLEKHALIALKNPNVQKHYHKYFDLVLVDEFQDTNTLQGELISLFVRKNKENLCVVGDPKQSIYRFRDADFSVFQDFYDQADLKHTLTFNFRSRPLVLSFINKLCEPLFQATGLSYQSLVPKREASENEGVFYAPLESPLEFVHFLKNKINSGEPLSDYVILLRKIRGNEKWLELLTDNGIPLNIGSGGFFWEDPKVIEVVCFLKWWQEPLHQFSGAVFLKSPVLGFTEQDFYLWLKDGKTLWDGFWQSSHEICSVLKPFLDKPHRPGELLLALLGSPCGARFEKEYGLLLMRLWHKCEAFSSQGKSFYEIVTLLSKFISDKKRESELPPPETLGQLRVLTIHGSKGLEFKNVILLDFWNKKERAKPMPLLYWDKKEGVYFSKRNENGDRLINDTEKKWKELEQLKELNEIKRVFYVALTRAEERLYLFFPENEPLALKPKEDPLKMDYWRAWIEVNSKADLLRVSPCLMEMPLKEPQENSQKNLVSESYLHNPSSRQEKFISSIKIKNHRPRMSVTEWALFQKCELSYYWSVLSPPFYEIKKQEESSMESLGTLVHECLEIHDFTKLKERQELDPRIKPLLKLLPSWMEQSDLMNEKREGFHRRILKEFSFEVGIYGQTFVGTMDRVLVDEPCFTQTGCEVSLVDFKVTQKEKSKESFIQTYSPQLALYSEALKKLFGMDIHLKVKIIGISPSSIQEIDVPLNALSISKGQVQAIQLLVENKKPKAQPSFFCNYCDWKNNCTASSQALLSENTKKLLDK